MAEETTVAQPEEKQSGLLPELMARSRLIIFGLTLAVELVIFFGAMVYPINQTQQQELVSLVNNRFGSTGSQTPADTFGEIFSNNISVALIEMVPAVGAGFFAVSVFVTGLAIQAWALLNGLPGPLLGVLIFVFPFAIVELSAYAIAVASGSMLILAWRRKRLRREARVFAAEVVLVLVCVFLAAAMETAGIVSPLVGFALWLPTAVGVFALVMAVRQSRKWDSGI